MELFTKDGHLTKYALQSVLDESLDDMGRLEVSEHLAFCDECLLIYTNLLTKDTLKQDLQPCKPIYQRVMQRIKQKTRLILFNRYASAAAAAVFAIMLWATGTFSSMVPQSGLKTEKHEPRITYISQFIENVSDTADKWYEDFTQLFEFNSINKGEISNEQK